MRKIILAVSCLLTTSTAFAADKSDGCGLGWQITSKTTFSATSTRGTTNGFVPPTLGMTSGTLGCAQHGLVENDRESLNYVATNFDAIKFEMARGEGHKLAALAETMGCRSAGATFGTTVQNNYGSIVSNHAVSPVEVVINLRRLVASELGQICS